MQGAEGRRVAGLGAGRSRRQGPGEGRECKQGTAGELGQARVGRYTYAACSRPVGSGAALEWMQGAAGK